MTSRISAANAAKSFLAFFSLYIVLFGVGGFLLGGTVRQNHLIGFAAAIAATILSIVLVDRGSWNAGVVVPWRLATLDTLLGIVIAIAVMGASDLLIQLTTTFRHEFVGEFPWITIVVLYIPAAVHEELLFRGYPFQKLIAWNPAIGVLLSATIFAGLHLGNTAVGAVALTNIALAGVLLTLAYLVHRTLWLPFALHIAWNIMSGPVLGHEVSGFTVGDSVLSSVDRGPVLLTGGAFGIEASIWTTLCETIAVCFLLYFITMRRAWRPMIAGAFEAASVIPPDPGDEAATNTEMENR